MILTGRFTDWWAYLTAPLIGGALAVATYRQLLRKARTPCASTPAVEDSAPT